MTCSLDGVAAVWNLAGGNSGFCWSPFSVLGTTFLTFYSALVGYRWHLHCCIKTCICTLLWCVFCFGVRWTVRVDFQSGSFLRYRGAHDSRSCRIWHCIAPDFAVVMCKAELRIRRLGYLKVILLMGAQVQWRFKRMNSLELTLQVRSR